MDTVFDIVEAFPLGSGNLWKVVFELRTSKNLEGYPVSDRLRITVRVTHEDGEPVSKLLETAYSQARNNLASAADFLAENTAQSLLQAKRAESEEYRLGLELEDDDAT